MQVVLITGEQFGRALSQQARLYVPNTAHDLHCINLNFEASAQVFTPYLENRLAKLGKGDDIIVLTDTPESSATQCFGALRKSFPQVAMLTGVNLPMLVSLLRAPENMNVREAASGACRAANEALAVCCR